MLDVFKFLRRRVKRDRGQARQAARQRYIARQQAGDTRGMHDAWPALHNATNDELRRAVGR